MSCAAGVFLIAFSPALCHKQKAVHQPAKQDTVTAPTVSGQLNHFTPQTKPGIQKIKVSENPSDNPQKLDSVKKANSKLKYSK